LTANFPGASPPGGAKTTRWPLFRSFAGWRIGDLGADAIAGLTLAAIAIPEQMATARLGGFSPELGFLALAAGAVGFAIFGDNRRMSVGADSTITPIFAGALAAVAAADPSRYASNAAALAIGVGVLLTLGGALRLGFIADLLSIPVTTGFLAGIAGHIVISQAPAAMGLANPAGSTLAKAAALAGEAGAANPWTLSLSLGVLAIMLVGERLSPRTPSALIGVGAATILTVVLDLEAHGVTTLGAVSATPLRIALPEIGWSDILDVGPLTAIVALVVMVQSAATTRAFSQGADNGPDVNRDFIGLGAANALAGLTGAFPVNASPPRTAIVAETGGVSQAGGLIAAALALAISFAGGGLLGRVPHAALAGVLLFVAQRIVRLGVMIDIWRRSRTEFLLIAVTFLAILILPIEQGVGVGIVLSLLHGVWTTTRARVVEFERIPGSSIWWPIGRERIGETLKGVEVIALQAPLSFLNAYDFQSEISAMLRRADAPRLVVIEANAIVEIDYTGASVLAGLVRRFRAEGVDVAFARLESVRAQESFARQGLEALVGRDHMFRSVQEAIAALTAKGPM
jgi:MFS superfamily sulfate permease-like transporter